jgi:hypothetical protein
MIESQEHGYDVCVTEGPDWAFPTADLVRAIEKALNEMGLR